jgi:hypothetical protein
VEAAGSRSLSVDEAAGDSLAGADSVALLASLVCVASVAAALPSLE